MGMVPAKTEELITAQIISNADELSRFYNTYTRQLISFYDSLSYLLK